MPASTTTYLILGSCPEPAVLYEEALLPNTPISEGQTEGQRGEQDRDGSQLPISNQRHQTSSASYDMWVAGWH